MIGPRNRAIAELKSRSDRPAKPPWPFVKKPGRQPNASALPHLLFPEHPRPLRSERAA